MKSIDMYHTIDTIINTQQIKKHNVPFIYSEIEGAVNGRSTHMLEEKKIEIKTMYQLDPARAVIILLHEYTHILSNRN